jgi:hypothetical protein
MIIMEIRANKAATVGLKRLEHNLHGKMSKKIF